MVEPPSTARPLLACTRGPARRARAVAAAIALCALAPLAASPVRAQGWPQPAAGLSVTGDPEILFTFDDGPNPNTTPKILDTLREYGVQAVFFNVGRMLERPEALALVERIIAEGHIIANHTMRHGELCRIKEEEAVAEIDEGYRVLHQAAAMPIPWFRTPYGARCSRLDAQLAARRVTHFHWDIDPQEWRHGNAKRTIAYLTRVLGQAQGREVVLMHDTKQATVKALPAVLQWIREENVRREAEGRRQIRIVPASQYAMETLAPGLWKWMKDVAPGPQWGSYLAQVLP